MFVSSVSFVGNMSLVIYTKATLLFSKEPIICRLKHQTNYYGNTYQSTWDLFGKHISYLEWRKAVHDWWSHIARALVSVGPTCKYRLRFFSCISLGCGITYFVYHYNSILKSGNCGGDEIALRWYNQYFVVKWHLSIKYMEAQFAYCCLILF